MLNRGACIHLKVYLPSVRYKVIEILAGGSCALVEWKLETGRTHQVPREPVALLCPCDMGLKHLKIF